MLRNHEQSWRVRNSLACGALFGDDESSWNLGNFMRAVSSRQGYDRFLDLFNSLIWNDPARRLSLSLLERTRFLEKTFSRRDGETSDRIRREKELLVSATLHTIDRLMSAEAISPHVLRVITGLWSRALFAPPETRPGVREFKERHGCEPPWFLVVSPGRRCNLNCKGCYAGARSGQEAMEFSTLERLIREARDSWGTVLVVFSGGEPLAYRSHGKGVLDIVEMHPELLFLMFTNGTLLDARTARRLEKAGNLTPAISVEGLRDSTDARRGAGTFDSVVRAMGNLTDAGVPVGVSGTITSFNANEILSDEFIEQFFFDLHAFYGFFFQYMPIGDRPALEEVPSPEQRLGLWRRAWQLIEERKVFLFDFWNSSTLVGGCVAAGRERGYLYIDWNGKVMPCVFAPYSAADINEIFESGGNLDDVWAAPFFSNIRKWQKAYKHPPGPGLNDGNLLAPCPIRDHYAVFREWIDNFDCFPENDSAEAILGTAEYYDWMVTYGRNLGEATKNIWRKEYSSID